MTSHETSARGPAPDLTTTVPGLVLRALTPEDAAEYYAVLDRNRDHLSRLGDHQEESAATPAWVRARLGEPPGRDLRYGIRLRGALIGRIDLLAVRPPAYGTGYWLDRSHVGAGFASAACAALYDHARRSLGATEIYAGVTHGNVRSTALLTRLGFEQVAVFEEYTRFRLRLTPGGPLRGVGEAEGTGGARGAG